MCLKEGNHFPGKQKSDSKTQDMFDNLQQKCFFESFPSTHFSRRGLSKYSDNDAHKYSDNDAHQETLKDSNKDVTFKNVKIHETVALCLKRASLRQRPQA